MTFSLDHWIKICNRAIQTGVYPHAMKLVQVIALYIKKVQSMIPTNIAQLTSCQSLTKYLKRFYVKDLFLSWNELKYRIVTNRCPTLFSSYYHVREAGYQLRQNDRLRVPMVRIDIGQSSCKIKCARLWNNEFNLINHHLYEKNPL